MMKMIMKKFIGVGNVPAPSRRRLNLRSQHQWPQRHQHKYHSCSWPHTISLIIFDFAIAITILFQLMPLVHAQTDDNMIAGTDAAAAETSLLSVHDENLQDRLQRNRQWAWRLDFSLRKAPDTFSLTDSKYREGLSMIAIPSFIIAVFFLLASIVSAFCLRNRHYRHGHQRHWLQTKTIIAIFVSMIVISFSIVVIMFSEQSDDDVESANSRISEFLAFSSEQLAQASAIIEFYSSSQIQLYTMLVDQTLESLIDVNNYIREGNSIRSSFTHVVFAIVIVTLIASPFIMFKRQTDRVALTHLGLILAGATLIFTCVHFASVVVICDACVTANDLVVSVRHSFLFVLH